MTEDKTEIFCIQNLNTGYGNSVVLRDLNLVIGQGEICCVIGEEGSGKSTLLKAIVQQIKSTGKITYNGIDLMKTTTEKMVAQKIDFIMQGGNVLKDLTIDEHILLATIGKSSVEKKQIWQSIENIFPSISLMKNKLAGKLSGGERMILSMACIVATDADFLLLDEPTAGLSNEICKIIGDFLIQMKNDSKKTILLLEHNHEFALKISDTIAIIKHGEISNKFQANIFKKENSIAQILYS